MNLNLVDQSEHPEEGAAQRARPGKQTGQARARQPRQAYMVQTADQALANGLPWAMGCSPWGGGPCDVLTCDQQVQVHLSLLTEET